SNSSEKELYSKYLNGEFQKDFNGKNPQKEGFLLLYYLAFYYITKFFVWRDKLNEEFKTKVNVVELFGSSLGNQLIETTNKLIKKENFQNEEDEEFASNLLLRMLAIIVTQASLENRTEISYLLKHIESFRIKTPKTSIYKLMRGIKYWKIMKDNGVLEDGVGLLLEADSMEQLQAISRLAVNTIPKDNISKISDKGVLNALFDNPHTVDGMIPFLNLGIKKAENNISLGEMMLKCSSQKERDSIIQKLFKDEIIIDSTDLDDKQNNLLVCNDYKKLFDGFMKAYNVNHSTYRISQIISVVGTLLDYNDLEDGYINNTIDERIKNFLEFQICTGVQETYNEISQMWKSYFTNLNRSKSNIGKKYDTNFENSIDKEQFQDIIKLSIISFIKDKSIDKRSKTGAIIEKTSKEILDCLQFDGK
ncbi:MAG: hypothetical protein V3575_05475, partial [Candidatus Absconditabacteria bacterium]